MYKRGWCGVRNRGAGVRLLRTLEGNKGDSGGIEIKGAVHAREMPRLRHVFLDNLFGNINHRERHEMLEGVRTRNREGVVAPVLPVLLFLTLVEQRTTYRRLVDSGSWRMTSLDFPSACFSPCPCSRFFENFFGFNFPRMNSKFSTSCLDLLYIIYGCIKIYECEEFLFKLHFLNRIHKYLILHKSNNSYG